MTASTKSQRIYTLDELTALLREHFGEDFQVTSITDGVGGSSNTLSKDGTVRATWESRLVKPAMLDGVKPRGPSEYYDVKLFDQPDAPQEMPDAQYHYDKLSREGIMLSVTSPAPSKETIAKDYQIPNDLWVRFGKGRSIIAQWDFEPFPPDTDSAKDVVKYSRALDRAGEQPIGHWGLAAVKATERADKAEQDRDFARAECIRWAKECDQLLAQLADRAGEAKGADAAGTWSHAALYAACVELDPDFTKRTYDEQTRVRDRVLRERSAPRPPASVDAGTRKEETPRTKAETARILNEVGYGYVFEELEAFTEKLERELNGLNSVCLGLGEEKVALTAQRDSLAERLEEANQRCARLVSPEADKRTTEASHDDRQRWYDEHYFTLFNFDWSSFPLSAKIAPEALHKLCAALSANPRLLSEGGEGK